MKHSTLLKSLAVAACLLPTFGHAQVTIYNEGFTGAGSTLNGAAMAPTSSSTAYQLLSTKNSISASSITASTLKIGTPATSAGISEVEALFPSITLATAGDYVNLQMTFVPTNVMTNVGTTNTLNVGLFNSGGVGPIPLGALGNSGLNTTDSTFATGGAQNWTGYTGRIGNGTTASSTNLYYREAQTATDNRNQDSLLNGSGTGAYNTPAGTNLSSLAGSGVGVDLTSGSTYTLTLRVTFDGTDVQVLQNLYSGTGTGGTNLLSQSGTDLAAGGIYTTFNALGIGYRANAAAVGDVSVNSLTITTNIPEPTTFAMLLGGAGLLALVRRRRF